MQLDYERQPIVRYKVPYDRLSRNAYHRKHDALRSACSRRAPWHEQLDQQTVDGDKRKGARSSTVFAASRDAHTVRGIRNPLVRSLPVILLVLLIVGVAVTAYGTHEVEPEQAADPGTVSEQIKSTARDQWIRGRMPYLYQTDPEWASVTYANGSIADSGCGPTCLSMVYVYLTGKKDMDPVAMAQLAERGGYIEEGNTRWAFMTSGARSLGLDSRELSANEADILEQLEAGHPVIVSVLPGDFTTKGHFIVLESVDSFGRILIRDPNSPERSGRAWDLSRIISQARNFWAFSV